MSATTVLARKWRPKSFAQLAGQEHVVQALSNALAQNRLHHAYLFTGTRGVGKTTIARIFAKSLNCLTGITANPCGVCSACQEIDSGRFVDLIELDAASNTGVDNMRELLENAMYAPSMARFKVYIIDEVHMLSKGAFNAMLKTLEEPPSHVKFILATTDPQKVPVTVLSRCLQFNLKQLPPSLIAAHLQYVLEQEQISFESGAITLVAKAAQGSMRDALSLLDQAIAFSAGKVEEAVVRTMLGSIDQGYVFELLEGVQTGNAQGMMAVADTMAEHSIAFEAALQEMASTLHRIALVQSVPQVNFEEVADEARLQALAHAFSPEEVQLYYQIAIHGRDEINLAPDEYAGFTMTLLRMLAFAPQQGGVAKTVRAAVSAQPVRQTDALPPVDAIVPAQSSAPVITRPEPVVSADLDWNVLLAELNVQGMALQLAKHCVLLSFRENVLMLGLAQAHKHLQTNKMAVEKLQAALSAYFAKPIKMNVVLSEQVQATPAAIEQAQQQQQQQQAVSAITQDTFVCEAQTELDARIVEASIKFIQ